MAQARVKLPGVEARAGKFPGPSLIPALHAIQERVGWLPREELVALAREVHRPLYEIEGLISFYPHFRTDPPKPVELHVCRDLSCWLNGAAGRIAELRQQHGADAEIELVEVSCLGRCDAAPAVSVNEQPATAADAQTLIAAGRSGAGAAAEPAVRHYAGGQPWPNDPYPSAAGHYGVLRAALAGELSTGQVITALQDSGLRGMGGAGFPTGRKWDLVAAQPATPKYVICNADESEPGTFKDRQILAEQPHLVLEGMLLGMLAVGAEEGWVFIRHEYGPEEAVIRREIESLRSAGLVGADVAGTGRRLSVEVFTSPGGYILGEESAMIECMEGHRGEPRNKPPFPGVYGLHGQPTLMNSVETFAHVPVIVSRGAAVVAGPGRRATAPGSSSSRCPATSSGPACTACRWAAPCASCWAWLAACPAAGGWARFSPAARRRTSSARTRPTCRSTSTRCATPGPCSDPARWWSWLRARTCSRRPPTCCGSSATSHAASACRAGSARPRRTRY